MKGGIMFRPETNITGQQIGWVSKWMIPMGSMCELGLSGKYLTRQMWEARKKEGLPLKSPATCIPGLAPGSWLPLRLNPPFVVFACLPPSLCSGRVCRGEANSKQKKGFSFTWKVIRDRRQGALISERHRKACPPGLGPMCLGLRNVSLVYLTWQRSRSSPPPSFLQCICCYIKGPSCTRREHGNSTSFRLGDIKWNIQVALWPRIPTSQLLRTWAIYVESCSQAYLHSQILGLIILRINYFESLHRRKTKGREENTVHKQRLVARTVLRNEEWAIAVYF